MEINDRLRDARKLLKISQKELSETLGFKQSYYSDIENSKKNVTSRIIESIRQKYNVSSEWLYTGNGEVFLSNGDKETTPEKLHLTYTSQKNGTILDDLDRPNRLYSLNKGLSERQLDFELLIDFTGLREAYDNYKKLVEIMHKLQPSAFLKDRFEPVPDFKEYKKEIEEEFDKDYKHLINQVEYKYLKIINLYQANTKHWQRELSELIDYMHRYADMFFENRPEEAKQPIKA